MSQDTGVASVRSVSPYAGVSHRLGRRIAVVGGGGKTTLAQALASKSGLPFIELDALHWKPNWQESSAVEFMAKVEAALDAAPRGWVVDGNYWSKLGDLVLRQADTVIFVNMPWRVMFWRVLARSVRRAWDRQRICGENYESLRQTFLSSKSLLWWHVTNRKRYGERAHRLMAMVPPGVPVIELGSPKALDMFYTQNRLTRDRSSASSSR